VAESAVVPIPVLSHESTRSTRGAGFSLLGHVTLS
jgi:hypothetical protein